MNNGKLYDVVEYINGNINGLYKIYHDTGNLKSEYWYEHGILINHNCKN